VPPDSFRVLTVEVVSPKLPVAGSALQEVIGDDEDAVADRHQRPLLPLPPRQPLVLRRQVGLLRMRGLPRRLDERVPQVRVVF
jgi:hypothetical protein